MEEYIKREALREAIQSVTDDPTCPLHIAATIDQYITEAPAADVLERKRGEWVSGICTACNFDLRGLTDGENDLEQWVWDEGFDFCPICGADMRGESHE